MKHGLIAAGALVALASAANAQVLFTGSPYAQNFDTLTTTTGSDTAWSNNSTLSGWSLFRQPAPGTAITTYRADTGSSNSGFFYSYGAAGAGDRAFGGLGSAGAYFGSPASGAVAGWLTVGFTNSTGGTLDAFTIGFDGEQWRNGGNTSAQTMVLEYGFGASFGAVATWNAPGGNFNWSSPVTGSTAAAVNGNVEGLVAGRGGTVTSLVWNAGDTLWFRWVENNDVGNDHGLSIDNLTFTAIPTPGAAALLGLAGVMGLRRRVR